jgi:hypothetical protein
MSIIFMEGFEKRTVGLVKWDASRDATFLSGYGLTGYGCELKDESAYIYKTFDNTYSQIYCTYKMYGYIKAIIYDTNGTAVASVRCNNATSKIELTLGNESTVLATGDGTFYKHTTKLVEFYYKPLNTGGVFTLKVDGVQKCTYTGDTTAGLENIKAISFYGDDSFTQTQLVDDIVVSDSGWLGNQYIQLITPNASGDSTQWTPSTGNNYDCVNEVVASDTDYVSTNIADNTDLYNLTNLTGSIKSVTAIDVSARMSYYGTPTPTKQKIAIKSTGEYYGDDISPALSYINYNHIWDQNPATSAAWLESEINSLQVGVKAIA